MQDSRLTATPIQGISNSTMQYVVRMSGVSGKEGIERFQRLLEVNLENS